MFAINATTKTLMVALFAFLLFPLASSHSWVEQLMNIAPNGTFVGEPGYPRGNVKRGTPEFNDPAMTYILPPNTRPAGAGFLPSDMICKETQRTTKQTAGSPRLKAVPGAAIALRFQENGHVSLPDAQLGKPKNRGHVYVYGTTDPRPDDKLLSIHKVWNSAGTGGDRRGLLLSKQNYDDGRCYQINDQPISKMRQGKFPHQPDKLMGADMWCQQDIALPQNAPTGKPYTLYWVWDWPTAPGVDPGLPKGKMEIYTTCMDVDIIEKPVQLKAFSAVQNEGYAQGQPLNNAAIPSQLAQLTPMMIPKPSSSKIPSTFKTSWRSTTQATQKTQVPRPTGTSIWSSSTGILTGAPSDMTGKPRYQNSTLPLSHQQTLQTVTGTAPIATQTTVILRFRRNELPVDLGTSLHPQKREEDHDETPGPVFPFLRFPGGGRARRFFMW